MNFGIGDVYIYRKVLFLGQSG